MEKKRVTTIPATLAKYTEQTVNKKKRRVAGYARVSTDHEEQQTSYEAQVDYYTNYIKNHDDWEFVFIYTDEGISGTNARKREGFQQMIADAKAGKIDLIITKSVSRFARNTVDSLTTVRELKERGIEIYFEKENIWTLDSKGELLITIMSSLAQEESRSISENVTWGIRKRFADGKGSIAYSMVMGFEKGPDGNLAVNHEQAEAVRLIFRLFLEGMAPHTIADEMTRRGIKSPSGKDHWNAGTVRRMLSNEKYKGDLLLQKAFTVDFLTKKTKINRGEVPQYYVEGNHEAIISPEVFDMVQAEKERRMRVKGGRYSGVSIFSNKIKCGDCGGWYGSKVWHSTSNYRKVVYRCNQKYNGEKCQTPYTTEDEVKGLFVKAFNALLAEKEEIIDNVELMRTTLFDTKALIEKREDLLRELNVLAEMTKEAIAENARVAQDQDEYNKRYNDLVDRYYATKKQYDEVAYNIEQREAHSYRMKQFINVLKKREGLLEEFDETLWGSMVDFVTIGREEKRVTFRDGTEITVK